MDFKAVTRWLFKRLFFLKKEFYGLLDKLIYQKQSHFLLHAWHAHRCPYQAIMFYSFLGRVWFGLREFLALISGGRICKKSIVLDGFDQGIKLSSSEGSHDRLWPESPFVDHAKVMVCQDYFEKIQNSYQIVDKHYHDSFDKTKDWEIVSEKFRALLFDEEGVLQNSAIINFRKNHTFETIIADDFKQVDREDSYVVAYLKAIDLVLEYHRSAFKVQKEILASLSESYAGNSSCVHYRGLRLSEKLLFYAVACDDIIHHVPDSKKRKEVILDIGTGYGALPVILKYYRENACYILVDLPEVTIFTAYYVKYNFPDAKIALFDDVVQEEFAMMLETYDFIIMPSREVSRIPKEAVDLVINTASMGFLSQEYLSYFMQEIDRVLKKGGYFYSINKTDTCKWGVGMYEWDFKGSYLTLLLEYNNRFSYPQWLGKKVN